MRKRDKAITIRMTEEEYALLCSKLAQTGISQQAFVINAITGIAIIPSEQTAVLKEISSTFALHPWSNNCGEWRPTSTRWRVSPTAEILHPV